MGLDFNEMYSIFEAKYNPYPVQMSRCEAFTLALRDGLIDEDTWQMAARHYGELWHYVGD